MFREGIFFKILFIFYYCQVRGMNAILLQVNGKY